MAEPPVGRLTTPDGVSAELRDGLLLGRAPHADLRLDNASVSREHAVIRRGASTWTVTDRGSRNGTTLNGTRVPMYVDCPLRDGDRLEVGAVRLLVDLAVLDDVDTIDQTRAMSAVGTRAGREIEALSHYQLQVVRELAQPWVQGGEPATNAEIAAALGTPLAVDAVKAALRRAYVKTGLAELPTHTKRRELCRVARDRRWV